MELTAALIDDDGRRVVGQHVCAFLSRVERDAVEDETTNAMGLLNGNLACDVGSSMAAVEVEAVDAETIESAQVRVCEVADRRLSRRRSAGVAIAEGVWSDHTPARTQPANQRLEHLCRAG